MLTGLRAYQFFDPDEGRHAEIAREMLESGDFVTPRLNYVPYLEKPPLMYWLTAASFRLLGPEPLALRLVSTLFAVLGMLVAWWLSTECFGRETGRWAPVILGSSVLYFVMARIPITDMVFSVLLAGALTAWLAGERRRGIAHWLLWLAGGALLGLALLAKGPVCLVLFALVVTAYLLVTRRPLAVIPGTGLPLLTAGLVALPWFLAVQRATPEFAHFFFIVQHVDRFLGKGRPEHVQPLYYYVALLPFAFGLWSLYWPAALGAARRHWRELPERKRRDSLFLLLWLFVVIGFFSASTCKLVQYILPVWWPLAAVTAAWLRREFCREQPRRRLYRPTLLSALWVAVTIVGAILAAGRQHRLPALELRVPLAVFCGASIVAFGLLLFTSWLHNRHWSLAQLGIAAVLPLAGLLPAASLVMQQKDLNGLLPPQLLQLPATTPWTIAQYRSYNQSLAFYTHRRTVLIDAVSELPLGPGQPDGKQWFRTGEQAITELSRRGPLALVVDNEQGEQVAQSHRLRVWAANDNRALLINPAGLALLSGPPRTGPEEALAPGGPQAQKERSHVGRP